MSLLLLFSPVATLAPPDISYASPATAFVGVSFSLSPTNAGGASTTWTLDSGALPTGLSLNATTGVISGTPTTVESQTGVIKAENAAGNDTTSVTITVYALDPGGDPSPGSAGSPGGILDETRKRSGIRVVKWNAPGRGPRI